MRLDKNISRFLCKFSEYQHQIYISRRKSIITFMFIDNDQYNKNDFIKPVDMAYLHFFRSHCACAVNQRFFPSLF